MTAQGSRRGLGYLPDPEDPRDYLLSKKITSDMFAAALPESVDQREFLPNGANLDQGHLGSCVANAIPYAFQIQNAIKGRRVDPISRLFIYWHARNQHGATDRDSGTYIRSAIKVSNKLGRVAERVYPYVINDLDQPRPRFTRKPGPHVLMAAHDKRVAEYERIEGTAEDRKFQIMLALASEKSVVFGTDVGRSFVNYYEPTDTPRVWPAPDYSEVVGGHAMCACGYDPEALLIVQSWGKSWGASGFARLSWDWITDPMTRDIWAIAL